MSSALSFRSRYCHHEKKVKDSDIRLLKKRKQKSKCAVRFLNLNSEIVRNEVVVLCDRFSVHVLQDRLGIL